MIISHKYKLIFIHIYKNGCLYFESQLASKKFRQKHIVNIDGIILLQKIQKIKDPELWNSYDKYMRIEKFFVLANKFILLYRNVYLRIINMNIVKNANFTKTYLEL